jgi:membrane fusion protein, multidrug efflux system
VLARLDTADLDAKLTDRIGALEASRAQQALAEKTRTQNHALLKQGFISQNAFDSAESNLSVTRGTLKSYEAQVQLARNALRDAVVTAPLSGTMAKRHVQPGEKVNFDSPLFTIVDLGKMELQAMVPANDIPEIKIGMAVELSIDGFGDRSFAGSVERINPMTEAGTRAILVFVQIPNPDAALKGGMFATGRIRLAAGAPVPTLPATAIRTEAGQTFVWTIEGGKLIRRNVSLGRRDEVAARVEIKSLLPAEAQVLAARFDNLKDGGPAAMRTTAPAKPAGAG